MNPALNLKKYNYISYSLWGDKPIYNIGVLKNIRQARTIYENWKVIVYYDDTVPLLSIKRIEDEGAQVVNVTGISYGMFWRFFAADIPDCNYAIFRDSDSRLSKREKLAVDEWIKSGKSLHIMRDHPHHAIPYGADRLSILGGMWGIKGGVVPMKDLIESFSMEKSLGYGIDQTFLMDIQTRFSDDAMIHDEFFLGEPFPIRRKNYRFIGERMDENDKPVGNDWEAIKAYYAKESFSNSLYVLLGKVYRKLLKKLVTLIKGWNGSKVG